jgi:hypothetical protein
MWNPLFLISLLNLSLLVPFYPSRVQLLIEETWLQILDMLKGGKNIAANMPSNGIL